ncbi:MAG TPA: hypothetical protein VIO32_01370 [Candidatus Baltobacteraceae bacterium]
MERFGDALARALDAAEGGDLNSARAVLESMRDDYENRAANARKARHDLGNLLSIAQASVEAMIDGVAPVTAARLDRVRELLSNARQLLYASTHEAD